MGWGEQCVWWQVYPLGFAGAPIREPDPDSSPDHPAHRLRCLEGWLDYVIGLGADGLLLGPVFASQTHGYDTVDHFRIDPRLGDDADFDRLVASCHERGLRVCLDGVFNHVGDRHPLYRAALANGPGSPEAALFRIDWDAEGGPRAAVFEGHGSLVALDHRGEAAVALTQKVMGHWLDRGADAWRLDAAYATGPDFWARVLPAVRAAHGEMWAVAEMIHGDYAGFVAASGVDSATQYELWKAIWSSLANRNFFELTWAFARHGDMLATFVPTTFVGNHDVTRIASQVGPELAVLAVAVLMTVGGIPTLYAGDEQAFTGVKEDRCGGDDAIRPAFPDAPAALAPFGAPVHRAHTELIALRRRRPWLAAARPEVLVTALTRLVYRTAAPDGGEALTVELDTGGAPRATVRDAAGTVLWETGA
jgi:glycosidase